MKVIIFWTVRVIVVVGVIGATHYGAYKLGYSRGADSVVADTIYVTGSATVDTPRVVYRYIKLPGKPVPVNIDSIYNVALDYWKSHYQGDPKPTDTTGYWYQGNYAAEMDTVVEDGDLKLWMSFISPMPLHPESVFQYSYELKTKSILPPPETTWRDRLKFNAGIGIGLTPAGLVPTIYIGYGYVF